MAGERTLPGIGLTGFWDVGSDYKTGMDANLRLLSVLVQGYVLSVEATEPGTPTDGDIHIASAAWGGGAADDIMVRDNAAWVAITPTEGWFFWDRGADVLRQFDGTAWGVFSTSKYLGTYVSLAALNTAHPSPAEGSYAHVDAGAASDVTLYIWDNDDSKFVASGSGAAGTIAVEDDAVSVVASATKLNFTGAGVSVADGGSGEATIDVPGGASVASFVKAFRATKTGGAAQAGTANVALGLIGETLEVSSLSGYSTSTGKYTVAPEDDGLLMIVSAGVDFGASENSAMLQIQRTPSGGGTEIIGLAYHGTATRLVGSSGVIQVAAGDVIEVLVRSNTAFSIAAQSRSFLAVAAWGVSGLHNRGAAITANYTLTASDLSGGVYREIDATAGNITITIPDSIDGAPVDFARIDNSVNTVTFAAGGTATVNAKSGTLTLSSQWGVATVTPRGSDKFLVSGDLS